MDIEAPKIVWDKTSHHNIFGITGTALKVGVGPKGKENPDYVRFTLTDYNPWEAVDYKNGIPLNKHIENIAYNFGQDYCNKYCASNSYLLSSKPSGLPNDNIQELIRKEKESLRPTSKYNYKPIFSKEARDVRFMFETAMRKSSVTSKENGQVVVDKANTLYSTINNRQFNKDYSRYAYHNRAGAVDDKLLTSDVGTTYYQDVGNTRVYSATLNYKLAVAGIEIGTTLKDGVYTPSNIVPDGYANNTPGYRPYKFYISLVDSSGNYINEKEFNLVLTVKDDIPPVGYGSVFDYKNEILSYFPYKTKDRIASASELERAPSYCLSGENYLTGNLDNDKFIRAKIWLPTNDINGYIGDDSNNITKSYSSLISLDSKIVKNVKNSAFFEQIKANVTPRFIEDNVETQFKVFVSDNCGLATATLTLNYFSSSDDEEDKTGEITSNWVSGADIAEGSKNFIASNSEDLFHAVFRGKTEYFPMAIPIKIYAVDNARDWDYYPGGAVNSDGNWKWNPIVQGVDTPNSRTFKTSLPIYSSNLDIRMLEKSMKIRERQ